MLAEPVVMGLGLSPQDGEEGAESAMIIGGGSSKKTIKRGLM